MEQTNNLELLFKDAAGSSKKITLRNPQEGLTSQVVQGVLDVIAGAEIFVGDNGDTYAQSVGARYVRRTVEDVYVAA